MYKISDGVRSNHQRDGGTVLDTRRGQIFDLSFVGSRIFELLQNGFSQVEIIDQIQREFQVNREVVESDFTHFCDELQKHGLIEQQITAGTVSQELDHDPHTAANTSSIDKSKSAAGPSTSSILRK